MDEPTQDIPVDTTTSGTTPEQPVGEVPPSMVMPPGPTPTEPPTAAQAIRGTFSSQPMLYPNAYTWLLLFSAMDIMFTWAILSLPGGQEVNAIANWVIERHGLQGAIVYKFVLVLVFVLICELVGRLRLSTGRTLSRAGVLIAAFPVVWSFWLLFRYFA